MEIQVNKREQSMSCEQLGNHIQAIENFARKSKKHRKSATLRAKVLRDFQNEKCKQETMTNVISDENPVAPGSSVPDISNPTHLIPTIQPIVSIETSMNKWVIVGAVAAVWYFFLRKK